MPTQQKRAQRVKPGSISIKVISQDGFHAYVKIGRGVRLGKMMEAFCRRKSVALGELTFMFDGMKIDPGQTPDELGLEDDAEIAAVPYPTGG